MTTADSEHAVLTEATADNSLREQDNRCTTMPSKQSSNRSRHVHSDQLLMDPANWLRSFLKTMALAAQEEPMLLEAGPEVARNVTRAKGCSHMSRPQQTAPGIRYCSQGTGETNRPTPTIHHSPGHQQQRPSNTSSSGILSSITSRSQSQSSTSSSNTDTQPNNTKSDDTNLSRDSMDPNTPEKPLSSSVSSSDPATTNTPSTSNTYQPSHTNATKHMPSNHDTVRSEITSIDLSSSTLLYSTNQVLQERLMQTTAFLHRTFSPTYRVGNLYIDSWTNGTQKRGLERLKTSVERGDAFMLMRNTAVQLKSLVVRSLAASRSRAIESERERLRSTGADQRSSSSSGEQGANKEKGSNSSNSGEGRR
ncbi:hypothetical protein MVEG_05267 [Podila verticillata NRRL 6337]|nr:hypothetical protein MVEG_05267 [Podila verticillata NRRL 6337]